MNICERRVFNLPELTPTEKIVLLAMCSRHGPDHWWNGPLKRLLRVLGRSPSSLNSLKQTVVGLRLRGYLVNEKLGPRQWRWMFTGCRASIAAYPRSLIERTRRGKTRPDAEPTTQFADDSGEFS